MLDCWTVLFRFERGMVVVLVRIVRRRRCGGLHSLLDRGTLA